MLDRRFLCLFFPLFTGIRHLAHVLTVPPPKKACLLCATPAGLDLIYTGHDRRHLPSAVPWISEDRLLPLPGVLTGWLGDSLVENELGL